MTHVNKTILFILIITGCKGKDLSTDCNITVTNSNGVKQISVPVVISKSDDNSAVIHSGRTNSQGVYTFEFEDFQVVNIEAKRIDTAINSGNGMLELDSFCADTLIILKPEKPINETLELKGC